MTEDVWVEVRVTGRCFRDQNPRVHWEEQIRKGVPGYITAMIGRSKAMFADHSSVVHLPDERRNNGMRTKCNAFEAT